MKGSAVTLPWLDLVSSVVWAPYGGNETGRAVGDIIFGHQSPSGRLPITFPRRDADVPAMHGVSFGSQAGTVDYSEGCFVGYRWYNARGIEPEFPFGHVRRMSTLR